jgi:hypothetical protein
MVDGKNYSGWEKFDVSAGTKIYGLVHRMKPTEAQKLSSEELKSAVDEATNACDHLKERYGKCYKNWQKSSLMRGGDMRYACEEFYDDFRACIVEHLAERGIHDVPFFGVSSKSIHN